MATYDYGGWIEFIKVGGDTYKVLCEAQPEQGKEDPSATWLEYPSGVAAWSIGTRKNDIIIKKIWFESTANKEAFIAFLEDAQDGVLHLKIKINSDNSYLDWDNDSNHIMPVMWSKIRGIRKKYKGNTEIWVIDQLMLRQSGALS